MLNFVLISRVLILQYHCRILYPPSTHVQSGNIIFHIILRDWSYCSLFLRSSSLHSIDQFHALSFIYITLLYHSPAALDWSSNLNLWSEIPRIIAHGYHAQCIGSCIRPSSRYHVSSPICLLAGRFVWAWAFIFQPIEVIFKSDFIIHPPTHSSAQDEITLPPVERLLTMHGYGWRGFKECHSGWFCLPVFVHRMKSLDLIIQPP